MRQGHHRHRWYLFFLLALVLPLFPGCDFGPPHLDPCPGPDPSCASVPTEDLPNFDLIFSDDFSEDVALGDFPHAVSDRWWAYGAGSTNMAFWRDSTQNGRYYPEKVLSVSGGLLRWNMHTENINGVDEPLVSAPWPKIHGPQDNDIDNAGQLYGRYAVRFRADTENSEGYKTAFLLWPDIDYGETINDPPWPWWGEIDWPEGNIDGSLCGSPCIKAFMHRQNGTSGGDQDGYRVDNSTYEIWHTAVTEWTPDYVSFQLDGVEIGRSTNRIPEGSMHWILQAETRIGGGPPPPETEANIQVDWVAVWDYTGP